MKKAVKYGVFALGGLVALAAAGAALFALTFDPNRYKGDIERLVKEQTGRTLAIQGPIRVAFWPSLGVGVGGVTFSERGSNEQFVSLEGAHASVKVMPLLRGEAIVDAVSLSGLRARIVKGKDGRYNFSDLVDGAGQKPAVPAKAEKAAPLILDVSSVSIERSSIAYLDLAAGQEYALEEVKLETGRIARDAEGKLALAMIAKRRNPPLQAKLSLDGKYRLQGGTLSADVTAKLDESTIKAKFTLKEPYEFDASIDRLNLDRYLGAPEEPAARKTAAKAEADTPLDFSALKGINAKGKVQVGALEVRGLKLADLNAQISAANGKVAVAPHSARLYEGRVSGGLSVDANRNHVALQEQLQGVAIGPMLRDFADQDRLEGKGDVSLDVTAGGASVNAMKRSLAGSAKVQLRDGAIKGINLAEVIRRIRGEGAGDRAQKTDFSELSASFIIRGGVAHNEDLDARAPALRLGGAGDIDIGASSLNYLARVSVVATSKGQGGAERDRLAGLTVPVRLSGPFDDLKYKVDTRAMAGAAGQSPAGEKIKERLGDKLKGLLGQ